MRGRLRAPGSHSDCNDGVPSAQHAEPAAAALERATKLSATVNMERSGTVRAGERGDGARSDGERRPAASSMAVQYSEGLPLPWDRIHSGCDWRACFLTASVDAYSLWHFRQTKRRPWAPLVTPLKPSQGAVHSGLKLEVGPYGRT